MVNDRTPQSLVNSSSLIWVSPNRALAGPHLPAPAPGARRTRALQMGGVTDGTGALSVEAVHPPVQTASAALGADLLINLFRTEQTSFCGEIDSH